jgi:hypothetical protein
MTTFVCAICGEPFEPQDDNEWNEEKAQTEARENYGDIPEDQMAVACDDCYETIIKPQIESKTKGGPMFFVITPEDQQNLRAATARAKLKPLSLEAVKAIAFKNQGKILQTIADREHELDEKYRENVDLASGHRVAISFEHQPVGLCAHFSVSTPDPKNTMIVPVAMDFLLRAILELKPDVQIIAKFWIEEFKEEDRSYGGKAVNALVLTDPNEEGLKRGFLPLEKIAGGG